MRLTKLSHVMFGVTDIEATDRFTADFGLQSVARSTNQLVKRTRGGDAYCYVAEKSAEPAFRGFAFAVEDLRDLEEAVRRFGATPVRPLEIGGCGGHVVTLLDPDGLRVDLVTGMRGGEASEAAPDLVLNSALNKPRLHAPQIQRPLGPAHLFRLGHIAIRVTDFKRSFAWYQETLGLISSDLMHNGDPKTPLVSFMRLNRGATLTDHHTLALFQAPKAGYHHASYEVQDYQAQFMAHHWLSTRGWELNWGVGRHPLGSHVFDMWFAPDRFRFETFSDTDVLNADGPSHVHDVHDQAMDLWCSDPPNRYFE